jgi:hypothetical protein
MEDTLGAVGRFRSPRSSPACNSGGGLVLLGQMGWLDLISADFDPFNYYNVNVASFLTSIAARRRKKTQLKR